MSLDYEITIKCNECGFDIADANENETYCYYCHEKLKDRIAELEEELEKANYRISELEVVK